MHHEHTGHNSDCQQDVHRGTGNSYQKPLPAGMRDKFSWISGASLHWILAGHLDVAAQRKSSDAIVGIAMPEAEQTLSKPDGENVNTDAAELGHRIVAKLV